MLAFIVGIVLGLLIGWASPQPLWAARLTLKAKLKWKELTERNKTP